MYTWEYKYVFFGVLGNERNFVDEIIFHTLANSFFVGYRGIFVMKPRWA